MKQGKWDSRHSNFQKEKQRSEQKLDWENGTYLSLGASYSFWISLRESSYQIHIRNENPFQIIVLEIENFPFYPQG